MVAYGKVISNLSLGGVLEAYLQGDTTAVVGVVSHAPERGSRSTTKDGRSVFYSYFN